MNASELLFIRLANQKLTGSGFVNPKETLSWMGAMQAQDFSMAKLALGIRTKDSTEKSIEHSFDKGEIIRTHLMRPTWHFVSNEDIYWLLSLTAPGIKASMKGRHRNLELSPQTIVQSLSLIENCFQEEKSIDRDKIRQVLSDHRIRTDENRLSHLLMLAELEGILCSGPKVRNKINYSLLSNRVPVKRELTEEESVTELTKKYYRSHAPATIKDFSRWSGLSVKKARFGLEMLRKEWHQETMDGQQFVVWDDVPEIRGDSFFHLLPAYDEFLIGYQDRNAMLDALELHPVISSNGIFRPVILFNGKVFGLWKRSFKKEKQILELNWFEKPNRVLEKRCKMKIDEIASFYESVVELKQNG